MIIDEAESIEVIGNLIQGEAKALHDVHVQVTIDDGFPFLTLFVKVVVYSSVTLANFSLMS